MEVSRAAAGLDFCYLTTSGRRSGQKRTIEIWFAAEGPTVYLLSGGREGAHWVQNIRHDPRVSVKIGRRVYRGNARIVEGGPEDARARRLLAAKYEDWRDGKRLSGWARTSLPVAIDLEAADQTPAVPA